jgi:hypothetical protein
MWLLVVLLFAFVVLGSAVEVAGREPAPTLFDYEKIQIQSENFQPETGSATPIPNANECKAFPGGADWPSDDTWNSLNATLNGTLLKPPPLASVCYKNTTYNNFGSSECESLSAKWENGGGIER